MKDREREIGQLIALLSRKSHGFSEPELVVVGGYALRTYLPFSRYSRDCDFALKDGLETVNRWKPEGIQLETVSAQGVTAFMRWSKVVGAGRRRAKLGLDFMQGAITNRKGASFQIGDAFLRRAREADVNVGDTAVKLRVAAYPDLFVLKVVAGRPSDVRDLAALVWMNGVPKIDESVASLNDPAFFMGNLAARIIPEMRNPAFLNSWKGMFMAQDLSQKELDAVANEFEALL